MTTLTLYHRLPGPARSLVATLRGAYLRTWRYGRDTGRLVDEALAREAWSRETWRRHVEERLAFVLHRAATRVPFYRAFWQERRRRGDRRAWDRLEHWPVVEKESLRASPRAFLADDCDPARMFHDHSSGTTGTAIDIWSSRPTVREWYALTEARARSWHGVTRHDRWAILGGQLVTPIARREPPFWVWNAALNQLYLSSYHLSAASIPAYLAALERHRVRYVWGYTSSLYAMADEALRQGRVAPPMQVVITNAEPVEEYQRDAISRVFGCPVRETYGMAELVAAASECGAGGLHLWPEVGYVEAFAGSYAVPAGTTGDLVCTSLLNADMPLIRYRVGDRGAVPSAGDACGCGRALPSMPRIEGRVDDVIYLADGRRVGRLDPVFKDRLPVREAQIVQESLGRVRIRYVPAPGFTSEAARSMIDRLRARVGAIEVLLEPVVEIPRGASGKFRAVVSELSPDERRRALAS